MRKERFGELSAYVTGGEDGRGGGDGPVVVLMHGFGAPGEDLVDLAHYVPVPPAVRWVFPEAPLLLQGGPGRAWWMIDDELFIRRMRGETVDRSEELPPALASARDALEGLLDEVATRLGAPRERQLLGGFSQGSMLACDVALHARTPPRALVLLSSTMIARSVWQPLAKNLAGVPVLQTHGTHDSILPFADAQRLAALLREGGAALRFLPFEGAHELPPPVLEALARFIASSVS